MSEMGSLFIMHTMLVGHHRFLDSLSSYEKNASLGGGRSLVNEKAYRLSFCEDPFLCDDSNDSVDTCEHKIRMLFQPTYVRFPL